MQLRIRFAKYLTGLTLLKRNSVEFYKERSKFWGLNSDSMYFLLRVKNLWIFLVYRKVLINPWWTISTREFVCIIVKRPCILIYGWIPVSGHQNALSSWYKWTYKTETHRLRKQTYGFLGGKNGREGVVREFGVDMYTMLYLKWVSNKDLLNSTWNSAQCYVAAWVGGDFGGEWIHVYMYGSESLCCSPETVTTLLINIRPYKMKSFFF